MCKLAKEGEGRRKRATGRGESGCNKHVASCHDSVLVSQVLAPGTVLEAACVSARKHVECDAAPDSRRCNAGSARLGRALLDYINESMDSSSAPRAIVHEAPLGVHVVHPPLPTKHVTNMQVKKLASCQASCVARRRLRPDFEPVPRGERHGEPQRAAREDRGLGQG